MRCDQKVLGHFKAFHKTKSLFSLSFYLIESHLESKKHLVTLDCFCTTVLREDSASKLQNGESRSESGDKISLQEGNDFQGNL